MCIKQGDSFNLPSNNLECLIICHCYPGQDIMWNFLNLEAKREPSYCMAANCIVGTYWAPEGKGPVRVYCMPF